MGQVFALEPLATTNETHNPSVERDLTNWSAVSSLIERSLERARFGRASVKLTTNGILAAEGATYSHTEFATSVPLTVSAYVRGTGKVRLRWIDTGNARTFKSDGVQISDRFWTRLAVTGSLGTAAPGSVDVFVETDDLPQAVTFYVDGLQIEQQGFPTTYADGDEEMEVLPHDGDAFFRWQGLKHLSASERSGRYRLGGRFRDLSQGVDVELWYTEASGFGMPPLQLNVQRFVTQEKVIVQGQQPLPRALILSFWASKNPLTDICSPASLRELHRAREHLEAILKPDRVQETQPFLLRYQDGSAPMDMEAVYEGGLEWSGDLRFPFNNSFPVRFFCPDPFWRADSQDVCKLDPQQLEFTSGLIARIKGEWLGFDLDGSFAQVIEVHPQSGEIYVGGPFTEVNGDTDCNRICIISPDGSTVRGLNLLAASPGIDDGVVRAIGFMPDGRVVVGGSFTMIDGVTFNRVALYDPSSDTFTTMGTTVPVGFFDASVRGIAFNRIGIGFFGGDFTLLGDGVTAVNRLATWDPSTNAFTALVGANGNGVDAVVDEVLMDLDGLTLFFSGDFTQETGAAANTLKRVASWNGSVFTQLGEEGADQRVRHMEVAPNGNLFACGAVLDIGFTAVGFCAVYNRQDWQPLGQAGDGLTGGTTALWLAISQKGLVAFGGDFTDATGVKAGFLAGLATWDGTRFGFLDVALPGVVFVTSIAFNGEDIWVGGSFDGDAEISAIHTCRNDGRARNGPVFEILGPADLLWLENQTSAQLVKLQFEVRAGETVRIDLRRGMNRAVSDFRGNVIADLLPESDRFDLLPGDNRVAFFGRFTDGDTELSLRWRTTNWSFDD